MRRTPKLHSVLQNRRGVAAAEFALIMPLLVTMLFAVFNIGNAVHELLLLQQALRAGGLYALSFPTQNGDLNSPNPGILMAIQQALPASMTANADAANNVTLQTPVLAGDASNRTITITATIPNAFLTGPLFAALNLNTVSYVIRVQ